MRDPGVQPLSLWGLPRLALAASALALIPTLIAAAVMGRPLQRAEVQQMIRLEALSRVVARVARRSSGLILLDEGPVFALSWLQVFFAANGGAGRSRWRCRTLRAWASRLDAVVRLDANDAALALRIRTREKPHPVKGQSDDQIREFTGRFRRAFDHVIGFFAGGGVKVLGMRTEGHAPHDDAVRLRLVLEATVRGR
jgi:hypothetical protein